MIQKTGEVPGEPAGTDGFCAGARYFAAMDCAIYLKEDVSYRAFRVSPALSLLLAPYADEVVGVKIKGVRHLTESLFEVMEKDGAALTEAHRVELRKLLQMAVLSDKFAEQAMTDAEALRRSQLAARAKRFLADLGKLEIEVPTALAA